MPGTMEDDPPDTQDTDADQTDEDDKRHGNRHTHYQGSWNII